MLEAAPVTPASGDIRLRFLELCQFRRLGKVQLDIDKKTTILVGANNSGKTSILAALRHFLADGSAFGAFDISLSQWPKLRALGKEWEALIEDPSTTAGPKDQWEEQLQSILSAMPTLDLWFEAEAGMYHYVAPFLSKFSWKGGAVGVRLRLEPAANVDELKQLAWTYHAARLPVKDSGAAAWSAGQYQMLALEHKLVATRGSFLDVYEAMVLLDPNAAAPAGSGDNKGPAAVQVVLNELADLEACVRSDGGLDEVMATEVFRRYGSLDSMPDDPAARANRVDEMLKALARFAASCADGNSTVENVLAPVLGANLFEIDRRFSEAYADKAPSPPPPGRGDEESKQERMRRGWCALFAAPWIQLKRYRTYLAGNSILATHQVVKGSEFMHVMVVMDDKLAGGTLISYDKIFGGTALSKTDKENVEKGKETTIDRTLRLLYVTCSRAQETLALVLWSSDSTAALARIKESGWFNADEFLAIPDAENFKPTMNVAAYQTPFE